TFSVTSVIMGALTYPLFGNWAWGGGWLSQLGTNLGLGKGYADFAGSGVVHSVGGLTALAVCLIVGPRIGKFNRDGSANPIIGHDISAVLIGCFILAFGWFGFNPGSTLGASANGNRSEEHTSELQSRGHLVCRLLLEKKNAEQR